MQFTVLSPDGPDHTEVVEKVYRGFCSLRRQSDAPFGSTVVISWAEGEPELWLVEDRKLGHRALVQYFIDWYGEEYARNVALTFLTVS